MSFEERMQRRHERWQRRHAEWLERHLARQQEYVRWRDAQGRGEAGGRRRNALWCYVRARLHRRLFVAFGLAILVTGVAVSSVMSTFGRSGGAWRGQVDGASRFVVGRFERVWNQPSERADLAGSLAREMGVDVVLRDRRGVIGWFAPDGPHAGAPERCRYRVISSAVGDGGARVEVCADRQHQGGGGRAALALCVALAVLWALSGSVSRRIARPLEDLARVVNDIGQGKLTSRMRLPMGREGADEVVQLAASVNDMAERIERQIEDQRQLLAAVSHELRSPLARMRFLLELVRDGAATPAQLTAFEREMVGIDALVGDLLANARLDFSTLSMVPLQATEVALRAVETLGVDPTTLAAEETEMGFEGDATLVACAVSNLVTNAERHGAGLKTLRVGSRGDRVFFEAEDAGEGFAPGETEKLFEPFYRGERARREKSSGVGLGLSLVKRIAEAHGGRAWAENLPGGGARVGVEFARHPVNL